MGVRTRLSALVFFAIVPLLALLVAGAQADRALTLENARARAADLARLGAQREAAIFAQAHGLLHVLHSLTQVSSMNWQRCDRLMAEIEAQHPQFTALGMASADGIDLCHSVAGHPARFEESDVLRRAAANPGTGMVVGTFRFNAALDRPTITLAMPFYQTASPNLPRSGIVFASLDVRWLEHIAVELSGEQKRAVLVVDARDGTVLVAAPTGHGFEGTTISKHPLERLILGEAPHGVFEADGLAGIPRIFGFARLPKFDSFVFAVGLTRDTVLAEANRRFSIAIALALVATAVATGAAWLLADITQLRPIRALAKTAGRLGAGDLAARARIEGWQASEFRALADTLGSMADGIAQARAGQSESDRQLRLLADNVTDMIVRIDHKGHRLYVSPSCRNLLGYGPEEMLAIEAADSVHPDDWPELATNLASRIPGGATTTHRYRLQRKDGTYVWVEGSARAMPAEPGRGPESVVVVRDIEQRVAAEQRLRDSEARYRVLAEHSTDMVFQLDRNMVRRYVSPACRELVGREPEDMVGMKPVAMAHPDDVAMIEHTFQRLLSGQLHRASRVTRIRHRDGHWVWIEVEMRAVVDARTGQLTGIIGASRDISARKKAEDRLETANRQLEALASQDALTGLVNRRGFDRALEAEFGRALRENAHLGLIMIDVDRFKPFNDLYGHQAGDECLRAVGRAVEGAVRRPHDVAARYGGEELAVLLPHTDSTAALQMAQRIRHAVRALRICHASGESAIVTISAGVACLSPQTIVAEAADLVRAADSALYAAKASGRDAVCAAPELWETASQTVAWAEPAQQADAVR